MLKRKTYGVSTMSSKRYWKIEGYDGLDRRFERVLPMSSLTASGVVALLQRLFATHLDLDEIVSSSLRQKAEGYTSHLESKVCQVGRRPTITVGENPHYVASVWQHDELSHNEGS